MTMIRQSRQQAGLDSLMQLLIVVAITSALTVMGAQSISLSAASSNGLTQQPAGNNHQQQQVYGLSHYPDEQQLIKKFMPDLVSRNGGDRSLERALINMLLAQRLYINDDAIIGSNPSASSSGNINSLQQAMLAQQQSDSTRAMLNGQEYEPMGPNQIGGYEQGKRSYWKQCAVNAVSCFGRRKRR